MTTTREGDTRATQAGQHSFALGLLVAALTAAVAPALSAVRPPWWRRRPSAHAIVSAAAVGGAVVFVLSQLDPSLLLANTTTTGGDMGAHVWAPAYLRDHLLPDGRLTGWAPDWYAGFPALTFYFPLPSLLIVGLDLLLPYDIAFKLVSVSGIVALPVAMWAFAKLAGLRFPVPPILAVATLPFLFDTGFTIYGGNILSTMAGEFAFSISLALGFLFLGLFINGMETGRYRALAAVLLAATGLAHVIPTFFFVAGAIVVVAMGIARHGTDRLRYALPVFVVAAALAAVWLLPFVLRVPYMNDMGWEKLEDFGHQLLRGWSQWYMYALALLGAAIAIGRRSVVGLFLVFMAVASAVAFCAVPQTRLWNARLLPFWFLTLHLLGGFAVGEAAILGSALLRWLRRRVLVDSDSDPVAVALERLPRLLAPALVLAYALLVVAPPLDATPKWFPISTGGSNVPGWVNWNYSGYQRKQSYPEYSDLVETMASVGEEHGCGRAMWEYEPELDRLGTPMALMLLPHWTDGCIGSMEGLFFESSATTPYHFLNQSELSARPSRPQRKLAYYPLDVAQGVRHLQMLGVRYYMAISDEAKAQARENPDLDLISTSGPWNAVYTENGAQVAKDRTWEIYRVAGSALVAPLTHEPVVVNGLPAGGDGWLETSQAWYNDPARWAVPLAASGPDEWRRVDRGDDPPRDPLPEVRVSRIRAGDDEMSFSVSRAGVPVLVRTSYFPNWKADGARGPWRVTPNLMVVIPTERDVRLHYGWTPPDVAGMALTALGLVATAALWWAGPVAFRERRRRHEADDGANPGEAALLEDDSPPSLVSVTDDS